jgi:hypothetical protein
MSSTQSLNAQEQQPVVPTQPPRRRRRSAAAKRRAATDSLMQRLADENVEQTRLVCSLRKQIAAAEAENRTLLDRVSLFHQATVKPDEQ